MPVGSLLDEYQMSREPIDKRLATSQVGHTPKVLHDNRGANRKTEATPEKLDHFMKDNTDRKIIDDAMGSNSWYVNPIDIQAKSLLTCC